MKPRFGIVLLALLALAGCGGPASSAKVGNNPPATLPASPIATAPPVTATPPPTPANCRIPSGWLPLAVAPGDTVERLAACVGATAAEVRAANCLPADAPVFAGQTVWLPAACTRPTPTTTANSPDAPVPLIPGDITTGLESVSAGQQVHVRAIGFAPNGTATLAFRDARGAPCDTGDAIRVPVAADGTISYTLTVPNRLPGGAITLTLTDDGETDAQADGGLTVINAASVAVGCGRLEHE